MCERINLKESLLDRLKEKQHSISYSGYKMARFEVDRYFLGWKWVDKVIDIHRVENSMTVIKVLAQ